MSSTVRAIHGLQVGEVQLARGPPKSSFQSICSSACNAALLALPEQVSNISLWFGAERGLLAKQAGLVKLPVKTATAALEVCCGIFRASVTRLAS